MHQKNCHVIEFQLDDQAFDAGVEIMKALAADARCRQERVGLFAHDGHQMVHRGYPMLAFERRVVAQRARDEVRLIDHAGADGSGVDFDQTDDVRILLLDEVGDSRQNLSAGAKVAGARHGKVERGPGSGGISYIVNQQSHLGPLYRAQCFAHDHCQDRLGTCRHGSIPYAFSSPTRGWKTTTTRACSSISRRRELFTTSIPASPRSSGRSTRSRSAKTYGGKSLRA